jgi:hypothetical protein
MDAIQKIEEWKMIGDVSRPLILKNMNLEILPTLPDNLEHLDCSNNRIICLRNLPASLKTLNCSNNNLPRMYVKSVLPPNTIQVSY